MYNARKEVSTTKFHTEIVPRVRGGFLPGLAVRQRGLTLVEVLVVLAVVSVLAGVVATAVGRARDRAKVAVDVSNMRQLGQAAALYEQTHGAHPMGLGPLRRTNMVDPAVYTSPLDPLPGGLGNLVLADWTRPSVRLPRRTSFVGWDDFDVVSQSFPALSQKYENPGWLVSLADGEVWDPRWIHRVKSPHRRLLMDTAVVTRQPPGVDVPGSRGAWSPVFYYFDMTPEQRRDYITRQDP